MATNESFWIEASAARALVEWKAFFAEQVSLHAKELAKKEKSPSVTLDHYRRAAAVAAQMLVTVVKESKSSHDRQEAA